MKMLLRYLSTVLLLAGSAGVLRAATWISLTNGNWGATNNWSGGIVPNAPGDLADIGTIDISTNSLEVTLNGAFTCGVLVVQDTAIATAGNLNLKASGAGAGLTLSSLTGTPVVSVTAMNGGKGLFVSTAFRGTQGLVKVGTGELNFRYSGLDMAFTGSARIAQGTYTIERNGSLGSPTAGSSVEMAGGKLFANSPITNAITLDNGAGAVRSIVVLSNSTIGVGTGQTLVVNGSVSGPAGFIKSDPGVLILNASNTLAGPVTNVTGQIRLGGGTNLLPATLQFQFAGASSLDLGGGTQALARLGFNQSGFTSSVSNGDLAVTGDYDLSYLATNGGVFSAVSARSFAFDRTNRAFTINPGGYTGVIHVVEFQMPTEGPGRARIAASNLNLGTTAPSEYHGNEARLRLGTSCDLFADTVMVGGSRCSGRIDVQPGVVEPRLVVRGAAGGSTRMRSLTLGNTRSGIINSTGVLDIASGSIDARINTLNLGYHDINTTAAGSHGYLLMGSGVALDVLTLNLGIKRDLGGSPVATGYLVQNGGTVTVQTANFGICHTAATPVVRATYILSNGLLRAANLLAGTGTVNATSTRLLDWTAGTIANYDAATDLLIAGQPGATGLLPINLAGTNPHVFAVDAARTILVGTNAVLSGAGPVTKTGPGRLLIAGSNTFTGTLLVEQGALALSGQGAIASTPSITLATQTVFDVTGLGGGFTLVTGQTLSGIGTVSGVLKAAAGAVVSPGASPGVLPVAGSVVLQTGSVFAVEIAGLNPGEQFDVLAATGTASLAGTLSIALLNDYVPDIGAAFTVLTASAVSGVFSATNLPAPPAGYWAVDYQPGAVVLRLAPFAYVDGYILHDINGNGAVDEEDTTNTLGGVTVKLIGSTTTYTTTTSVDGVYAFASVVAGSYTIVETDPPGFVSTADEVPPNDNQIAVVVAAGDMTTGHWFLDRANASPYDLWTAGFGLGAGQETADADGDGFANLLEYAAGTVPTNGASTAPLSGLFTGGVFKLSFTRNTNAVDLSYFAEAATGADNAAGWTAIATNRLGIWSGPATVVEAGTGTPVTVTVTDPAAGATNRFLRLRVSKP